ncbi:uncharacterized protein TRIADDRAFT_49897 [Trichoplax adhaerens]|uniref:Retinoid X receptor n=1 Tax=Trichoplax adhaerens TaxID=10228 RepID=B3RPF4_TRIAD|nr:hypothetical protein TRIADDRAFT_49897 [Trichoplax adhaerens]EDV27625.1 hypothetical protein TRIADDRAFT_49897 [Trichoplax adhaerens]|eukprot:XP_002109459.1 hypothetical protein TRIADDRAFT_49897 [Trichoplax adhaerens]
MSICGQRSLRRHYGVYSCEGCKGFFKRTVRKNLTYTCRDNRNCDIDKKQRNRCQYCRYQKCLQVGMKQEAVQEERVKNSTPTSKTTLPIAIADGFPLPTYGNDEMPVEAIRDAESTLNMNSVPYVEMQSNPVLNICQAADKQLFNLVEWAKKIPHFCDLCVDDQVILLRSGWNELLIAAFSFRSIAVEDGLLLSTGHYIHRTSAHNAGIGAIFDRILTELVNQMRYLKMDKTELGCLRAIILFNPDVRGLTSADRVEKYRELVYGALEAYVKKRFPDQLCRFAKLLLRLPALRAISLKTLEHLFFYKLIGDPPIDTFLMEMLETGSS